MSKEKIGFIGVGLMGHGMAKNIVEGGHALSVLAFRKREAIDDLLGRGAREVKSTRAIAETSDIVVLCVTGSPEVETILPALAEAGRPLLVIDCSTADPASTMRLAREYEPAGIRLVDAPLSRTPKEAWAGTLDVMVGGDPTDVARARPVIDCFAGRVVETGPVGSGHAMKLLNNFVAMGYASLYAEALAVGARSGITADVFHEVIGGGRMDCPFFRTFFEYVVGGNPDAHKFTISNALKDMTYLASLAGTFRVANPVGAAVRNSFALAAGLGRADDYVPMLADSIATANGIAHGRAGRRD